MARHGKEQSESSLQTPTKHKVWIALVSRPNYGCRGYLAKCSCHWEGPCRENDHDKAAKDAMGHHDDWIGGRL
jgi:hypothetical protein